MSKETEIKENNYLKCGYCGETASKEDWDELKVTEPASCPKCGSDDLNLHEVNFEFDIEELDMLRELKNQKSEIEKKEKPISSKWKKFFLDNQLSRAKIKNHNISITYQDRSEMDEEKLVSLIKNVMTEEEIKNTGAIIEKSNPLVVQELLNEGKLTMKQVASCKIENLIPVFNFKTLKSKKQTKASTNKTEVKKGDMF